MISILDTDIKYLKGVGPARATLLTKEFGIATFRDLLYFFPFRYVDRSKFYSVSEIDGTNAYIQLRGRITKVSITGEGKAKRLIAVLYDGTACIDLVFFKGLKWMQDKLKIGSEYIVFGKPSFFNKEFNMVHPEIETVSDGAKPIAGSMDGIYPSTDSIKNSGLSNKSFSKLEAAVLEQVLPHITETLPQYIIENRRLCPLTFALRNIHFPQDLKSLEAAKERLKFEELFYLQLSLLKQKHIRMRAATGVKFNKLGTAFNTTYNNLPFPLTNAQKRVIKDIRKDLVSGIQMNRLLQGDVGSGKTLVAILSAMMAVDNGYQACIMAPTEVLANQHYNGVFKFIKDSGVNVALLTGSTKTSERKRIHAGLEDGTVNVIFGTHALIEDNVRFKNLGIAIIDEQHRFGVDQRSKLWKKNLTPPHILVMTATPIPRTLAMTLYGDLDVSVIDELPPGRKPIQTIHWTDTKRSDLYNFMRKQISLGRQIFVVYPLIKESEKMDYQNLEDGFDRITEAFPPDRYIVSVVHGKQKNEDKAISMDVFVKGKANILVATSVIEVGVDVPNASVMVIESAERFGLSQLHQLRGRVGRGAEKSYCILMTGYKLSEESKKRIDMMCQSNDGFELAELDLKMRGPGDFEGTRQSGLAFDLHIANIGKDSGILEEARRIASAVLDIDPDLSSERNSILVEQLKDLKLDIKDYSNIS